MTHFVYMLSLHFSPILKKCETVIWNITIKTFTCLCFEQAPKGIYVCVKTATIEKIGKKTEKDRRQKCSSKKKNHMEQLYFLKGHFSKCVLKASALIIISPGYLWVLVVWLQWTGALYFPHDSVGSF